MAAKKRQVSIKGSMGALTERVEAIREKLEANQGKMEAIIRSGQEEMKATINSIRSKLEKTIKRRLKDFLASVNQSTQGLCEEFNETEQMQFGLHGVTLYPDKCPGNRSTFKL
jgi:signal transduction histidine kinase